MVRSGDFERGIILFYNCERDAGAMIEGPLIAGYPVPEQSCPRAIFCGTVMLCRRAREPTLMFCLTAQPVFLFKSVYVVKHMLTLDCNARLLGSKATATPPV